jgi:hypothetical protein
VLNDPRAYGKCYDVGCDDILTSDQMIDVAAEVLGRNHPVKIHLPGVLLTALASLIERLGKVPKGAVKGLLDGMKTIWLAIRCRFAQSCLGRLSIIGRRWNGH